MKKRVIVIGIILVIIVIAAIFIIKNVNSKNDNKSKDSSNNAINSKIVEFSYSYGSYFGGYNEYNVYTTDEGIVHIDANGLNGSDLHIDKDVDESVLNEIDKIVNEYKIYNWDGFDKSDEDVLDGDSFEFKVSYENGKTIFAHGYMKYPDNYKEASDALINYFNSLK